MPTSSPPYLALLEALRVSCSLPPFPDPLPSNQLDLELENGPTVTIDLEEETDSLEIFSQIGTYTAEQELTLLKKIASDNFLWSATAGATLSIRPEVQTVYLAYQVPVLSLNGTEFVHLVEKFVEIVSQWQKFLSSETSTTPQAAEDELISPSAKIENLSPPLPGSGNFIIG